MFSTFSPKILPLLLFLYFLIPQTRAQNAPVTTASDFAEAEPGNISVPVTVTGFTNIGAISLSLDYDYSVQHFTGSTPNPQLQSFIAGDLDLGSGFHRITMGWYGTEKSLDDGSTIITLHFSYISGNSYLAWYDNGPSCEYADGNITVLNDVPQATYYIDGHVCGALDVPGPIMGYMVVCAGQQGVVYSVDPIPNATGYVWGLPDGADIVSGENTNAIMVDFGNDAASGDISVYGINDCSQGPASELTIVVNSLPVAFAGNDTTINYGTSTILHAEDGGEEPCSYLWSPAELLVDPNVQDPETIILTESTVFTVLVTNLATNCQNSDQVIVSITGGPLSVNPVAMPEAVCPGNSSQLYSNAGGGSGNYSYLWTSIPPGTPPWGSNDANPVVMPDTSTIYLLEVNDGFTTVSDSITLTLFSSPTATITGGDTLCGESSADTLRVDLTGSPPWNFSYTYGNTTVYINNQQVSPYYIIASDPGDYFLNEVNDAHCQGVTYGTAVVRKYPVPATPEITVNGLELISSSCCGNQWYQNGSIIPGAVAQTYHVSQNGLYHVVVTMNNCSSLPSDTVDIIVGITETRQCPFTIFPNPADNQVTILRPPAFREDVQITLYSASGTPLKIVAFPMTLDHIILDTRSLHNGMYFLVFQTGESMYARKLVVK